MTQPIIGWEQNMPVPDGHRFNHYLTCEDGRLHLDGLDLTQLFDEERDQQGFHRTLPSPLEIVYLPIIRHQIDYMRRVFAEVTAEIEYEGAFHY
nr:hypothetical protein [Candidatus Saccharibacteria bacterium]